jgi:hypothetical protein
MHVLPSFWGGLLMGIVDCKMLSRIVEKFLEINNVTVEQTMKALPELPNKARPDYLTAKFERLKLQWDKETEISLESVLERSVR